MTDTTSTQSKTVATASTTLATPNRTPNRGLFKTLQQRSTGRRLRWKDAGAPDRGLSDEQNGLSIIRTFERASGANAEAVLVRTSDADQWAAMKAGTNRRSAANAWVPPSARRRMQAEAEAKTAKPV